MSGANYWKRMIMISVSIIISVNILGQSEYKLSIEKISENIYLFKPSTQCKDIVDANCIAIIGTDAISIIDGHQRGGMIKEMIATLKGISKLPVRYIINTHFHGDHSFSNMALKQQYPGASVIAHTYTAGKIDSFTIPTMLEIGGGYKDIIKMLEDDIRLKKKYGKDTLSAYELSRWKETLKDCHKIVADYKNANAELVRVNITISDTLRFHNGIEWVEIFHTPYAHTEGDLMIWLPSQKILITGDVIVSPVPYAIESSHKNWQEVLKWIIKLNPSIIIPGHGDIQKSSDYTDHLAALLKAVEESVSGNFVKQMKFTDLHKKVAADIIPLRKYFTSGDPEREYAFDGFFLLPAVYTYFKELTRK